MQGGWWLPLAVILPSATGTRTRVARVRAEYPNQLDYIGYVHRYFDALNCVDDPSNSMTVSNLFVLGSVPVWLWFGYACDFVGWSWFGRLVIVCLMGYFGFGVVRLLLV